MKLWSRLILILVLIITVSILYFIYIYRPRVEESEWKLLNSRDRADTIDKHDEMKVVSIVGMVHDPSNYENYIRRYPHSKYTTEAKKKILDCYQQEIQLCEGVYNWRKAIKYLDETKKYVSDISDLRQINIAIELDEKRDKISVIDQDVSIGSSMNPECCLMWCPPSIKHGKTIRIFEWFPYGWKVVSWKGNIRNNTNNDIRNVKQQFIFIDFATGEYFIFDKVLLANKIEKNSLKKYATSFKIPNLFEVARTAMNKNIKKGTSVGRSIRSSINYANGDSLINDFYWMSAAPSKWKLRIIYPKGLTMEDVDKLAIPITTALFIGTFGDVTYDK